MTRDELKSAAVSMLDRAYVPYSHFPVGAALECDDGTVYTGCNVENAAYPAGICAERNAIFHAVSDGHTAFKRIVVAGKSDDFCVPCGVCRQVMREFCEDDFMIYMVDAEGYEARTLAEILPFSFSAKKHMN